MNQSKLTIPLAQAPLSVALMASLSVIACTEPNPSYEACQARPYACTEVELCDGVDGDGDGQVDEGLDEPCGLFMPITISGVEGKFGRSIAVFDDLDGDGYEEVYIGASPALHRIGELPPVDPQGSVFLLNGQNLERLQQISRIGVFGAQVAVGDFDGDGERELAAANPFGGDEGQVGVWVYERDGTLNARYLAEEPLTRFGTSITVTQPQAEGVSGDALLVSEPLWSGEAGDEAGRLVALTLKQGRAQVDHSLEGTEADQKLGERILSSFDKDGDGLPEVLSTLWRTDDQGASREVWLLNGASGGRELRVATNEDTQGSFGEGLAWGYFHGEEEPNIALGAPRIQPEEGAERGRVYFVNETGESLGTTGVEGKEYGSALLTIKRSPELGDLLLVAGRGFLRLFGPNREVARELPLEFDEVPTLATSSHPDPDGRIRVYVGFPEAGKVYILGVR